MAEKIGGLITGFTAASGIGAFGIALLPVFVPGASETPFLSPLFVTCTHLFSTGVGALLMNSMAQNNDSKKGS